MELTQKTIIGLALLTFGVLTAPAAQAQSLTLGQSGSPTLSGIGALTNTGTTASGTYTYDNGGTGVALANQNDYSEWNVYGTSTANVTGGHISFLLPQDSSTTNVSGGTIGTFQSSGLSTANISGGAVSGFSAYNSSTANISGGTFHYPFNTNESSRANVSGGTFQGGFETDGSSTLDLFGTGLTETFQLSGFNFKRYQLTGTLQNGDQLNVRYDDYGGTLEFNVPAAVPETSSVASLSLLLLGLGAIAVSRRRKGVSVQ